jgi:hypothetical protein
MTPAQFWAIEMQNQQNQQQNMQQMTNQVFQAAGALAGQFAENKALDAKGGAYADFLKSHGSQLGFETSYLDDLLKKPKRELAMIGDSILGMQNTGNRLMSLNYLDQQAQRYPGGGGGTGASGAGGVAGMGNYAVGQGWMGP